MALAERVLSTGGSGLVTDAPKLKWTDLFGMDPDYPTPERDDQLLADLMRRILTGRGGYVRLTDHNPDVPDAPWTELIIDGYFPVDGETEALLRRIFAAAACQPSAEGGSNHEGTTG